MITDDDKKEAIRWCKQYFSLADTFEVVEEKWDSAPAVQAYLAGVAHARKPHVVAERDLPEMEKMVLIMTNDKQFDAARIFREVTSDNPNRWRPENLNDLPDWQVECWWHLPEVSK